jgi:hypothetical protein
MTKYVFASSVSLQGTAANQVEHEQLLILSPTTPAQGPTAAADDEKGIPSNSSSSQATPIPPSYSFVWLSGSAPVLWYQVPDLSPRPSVWLNPDQAAQAAAFRVHVEGLRKEYQSNVMVLDLLRGADRRERQLKLQLEELVAGYSQQHGPAAPAGAAPLSAVTEGGAEAKATVLLGQGAAAVGKAAPLTATPAAAGEQAGVNLVSRELWCGGRWQLQKELQLLHQLLLPSFRHGILASSNNSERNSCSGIDGVVSSSSSSSSSRDKGAPDSKGLVTSRGSAVTAATSAADGGGGGGFCWGGNLLRVHSFEGCDRVGLVGGWLAQVVLEEQLRRAGLLMEEQRLGDIMPQVR